MLPEFEKPTLQKPICEKPILVFPTCGNRAKSNTNSNQVPIKSNTYLSNIHQSIRAGATDAIEAIDVDRQILKENIGYDSLCASYPYKKDEIGELLELMLETVCSTKKTIRVKGEDKPAEVVKSRMMELNQFHIEYVLEALDENTTDVRNINSYMLTALYNAPGSMGNYYKSKVNHDLYGDN
jgi:hypothetical protein